LASILERHFDKPDLQTARIILGTIKAHHFQFVPAWLFVAAPPRTGKTIISIMGATLLSPRDKRTEILAQLCESPDAQFKREFGGRLPIIAAVTPVIDPNWLPTSGECCLQVCWHGQDYQEAGLPEEQIRDCSAAIRELFETSLTTAPALTENSKAQIAAIAEFIVLGRTRVSATHVWAGIEYVPGSVESIKIAMCLEAITRGIAAIGRREEEPATAIGDAIKIAFDSIPEIRSKLLRAAINGTDLNLAPMPPTLRNRTLEDLHVLRLLQPLKPYPYDPGGWTLTWRATSLLRSAGVIDPSDNAFLAEQNA
jgi:hypothetical protein